MKRPPIEFISRIKEICREDSNYPPFAHLRVRDSISAYGLESMIAKQSQKKIHPKTFAFWIHGWVWGNISSPQDLLASSLDKDINVLVRNDREKFVFQNHGYKNVFSVGLPFLYTHDVNVKRQEGSLLVFPPHSTNDGDADFNNDFFQYLDYIKDHEKDFSEIGLSLYGLDYKNDLLNKIKKYEFSLVPGAHWTDKNSLLRLKYNLKKFEYSTTNQIGSHMVYALYSGQKFSFTGNYSETSEEEALARIASENPNWSQETIDNALQRYSYSYIFSNYSKFFKDSPIEGVSDLDIGKREIGHNHKRSINEITYLLGWNISAQAVGFSRKVFSKFNLKKFNLGSNKKSRYSNLPNVTETIVFIDTIAHLKKALQIIKEFNDKKYTFITNNIQVFDSIQNCEKKLFNKRSSLVGLALDYRKRNFNLLTARVDDINFQIFDYFSSPNSLHTLDEGLFTLKKKSIYNSNEFLLEFYGYKSMILNAVFGFPKNASTYYQNTSKHFTWFSKKSFESSIILSTKLIEMKSEKLNKPIKSVFIGQPWKYMDFSDNQIINIFSTINQIGPSIYMLHPREDLESCRKYFNPEIIVIRAMLDSDSFCNALASSIPLDVYTVASTVATDFIESINIKIICSERFPLQTKESQATLLTELENQDIEFERIHID